MNTSHALEQLARSLRQRGDWKRRLDPSIQHQDAAIFVGPIAAGEKVVASTRSTTAKLIARHFGDALAVEMEGRGFLQGVHINDPVRGCVIRGISDLLSGKSKSDKAGSQRRAADSASAVAFEMLARLSGEATASPGTKAETRVAETRSVSDEATVQVGLIDTVARPSLDNTIEFAWDLAPSNLVTPEDGKSYRLTLSPTPPEMVDGTGTTYTTPGSPMFFAGRAYACKVTNHSDVAIFNATLVLRCAFWEVISNAQPTAVVISPGSVTVKGPGKMLIDRAWTVFIPKLEAHGKTPFVFYIFSPNDVIVTVGAPETISFKRLGSDIAETTKIIEPNRKELLFFPPEEHEKRLPELSPLAIVCGEGPSFEMNDSSPAAFWRRLGVAIENHDLTRTLRNCALTLIDIQPASGASLPRHLGSRGDVDPGGRRLILVASYREQARVGDLPTGDSVILIGAAENLDDRSLTPVGRECFLTLRATATDTPASEIRCRAWVENGQLRIQRV